MEKSGGVKWMVYRMTYRQQNGVCKFGGWDRSKKSSSWWSRMTLWKGDTPLSDMKFYWTLLLNIVSLNINMSESQIFPGNDVRVKKEEAAEKKPTRFTRPKIHKCWKCSKCYAYAIVRNRHEEQCGQNPLNVPLNPAKAKNLKRKKPIACVQEQDYLKSRKTSGCNIWRTSKRTPITPWCVERVPAVTSESHL